MGTGWRRTVAVCLVGLFTLAILFTLHIAQEVILPVVLAVFLAIVLSLPVRQMRRVGLPDWISALLVTIGFVGAIIAGIYFLSGPAAEWLQRAPQVIRELEVKIAPVTRSIGGATEVTKEIERLTEEAPGDELKVDVAEPSLNETLITRARDMVVSGLVMVVLLFFLLAGGRQTVTLVARALSPPDRRVYDSIVTRVQDDISLYLQTITVINAGLGLATAGVMYALDMPSPALWGTMVGLLNFMPYLGAATSVVVIAVVAVLTFGQLPDMILPPLAFLVLTSIEGHFLTPMIVGKRLTLNPLVVFLSVVFWGWLWGVPGALLAVPIMAIFKITLDHTDRLRPLRAAME